MNILSNKIACWNFWILFILAFQFPSDLLCQLGYYATGNSKTVNVEFIDGGDIVNSRYCHVYRGDTVLRFSPSEVWEYGFNNGRVYFSREIHLNDSLCTVFLERLTKGPTNLYYYRNPETRMFFVEKDSGQLIELPRPEKGDEVFWKQLSELTADCGNVSDAIKLVQYNKSSLEKFVSQYNRCELKPFPHFRYGVTMGYEMLMLIPSGNNTTEELGEIAFSYDGGYTYGLFVDNPILTSDFSLHAEIYFSRHGFSYSSQSGNRDIDFISNIASLKFPVLIRYTFPKNKFRPFINAGGVFSRNILNANSLYQATRNTDGIFISNILGDMEIDRNLAGIAFGMGLEYTSVFKKSLFFELRFIKSDGLSESNVLSTSSMNFNVGIIF